MAIRVHSSPARVGTGPTVPPRPRRGNGEARWACFLRHARVLFPELDVAEIELPAMLVEPVTCSRARRRSRRRQGSAERGWGQHDRMTPDRGAQ